MSRLLLLLVVALLAAPLGLTAAQEASPVAPGTPELLLSVVFPAEHLPTGEVEIFYYRVQIGAGGTYASEVQADSVLLEYVLTGRYAVRSDGPVQILQGPSAATPGSATPATVAPGTEATAGPGEGVVWLENDLPQQARIVGDEAATIIAVGVFSTTRPAEMAAPPTNIVAFGPSGFLAAADVAASGVLGGDIMVRLERVVLAPGQAVSPAPPPALQAAVQLGDGTLDLGALRNIGQNPLEVIVATLTPVGPRTATPAAATPAG